MTTATARPFDLRADEILRTIRQGGQEKILQVLESPMDARVRIRRPDGSILDALCFCSNNYLGLANHPEVVEAGVKALRDFGAGTASVRFICGTFSPHLALEETIARYMGTESAYTFVSCWTATEALFPTLCEAGDFILSDELNHACIIDAIRLTPVIKKGVKKGVYKHADLADARRKLEAVRADPEVTGQVWLVTDGVFSMEGAVADLPALRALCDEFNAILIVDDSHGHGVMGERGRGTHEYWKMPLTPNDPRGIDVFTGTLGKALGGGAGGFVAGPKRVTDLIVQRGRPTLFSNALPVTVAASAKAAIDVLMREPQRVKKLRDNVASARKKIGAAGFDVLESPTAILPIIVGDTAKAIAMSKRLLDMGVFVIGFGFPVVPEGAARLRVQISAAHEPADIDALVDALKKL
ncbi:MAG: aminotransferase class I/II-fold pyridoxal phosphate-dependent enzyme [Phycisphaerales bacterium]|jgi:glycine C-acetyltransferase|nr:aminotransferase class I/II-fold pyridoxal phosphate-dependent enzyme [Phycisphaerales bacterium]